MKEYFLPSFMLKNSNNYFPVHDSAADITPTMMEIYTKI
jgi:hypothetical protein